MEQNFNPEGAPQNNGYQQDNQGYNPNPQYQQQPSPQYQQYQQPANNMVKPDSGLVWAILSTILCCLPFGIVAIVKASQVDNLWAMGRHQEAYNAAKSARTWSIVSAAVGLLIALLYIVYMVVLVAVLDEVDGGFEDLYY